MSHSNAIEALARHARGQVFAPGEPGYDAARTVWNAMIDRRPALVVRAARVEDVRAAVDFAREQGYPLTVRGGGHNVAGSAVCDGGLLIDLSGMCAVRVDRAARVAHVEGGAKLKDLDRETQATGLVTTGGVVSSTGVAGFTLGGGFGWLARKHGLAADNIVAVELVTADAKLIRASPDEHAELYWALRGGGGNFGAATRFEFALHGLDHEVLFGPTVYRLDDATAVLRHYRDFCATAPRECCVWADLLTAPPLPFLPEACYGTKVLSLMQCYSGDPAEGERVLAPLRGFGAPIADAVGPMPYRDAQTMLDAAYAHGARNYWSSQNYTDLTDATLDTVTALAAELPTAESDLLICQLGGAIDEVAAEASAYPHRGVKFAITPGARWRAPADDARCVEWTRRAAERLAPGASGGAYVNFLAEAQGAQKAAYGSNLERLVRIKRRYDPDNVFRGHQNIAPSQNKTRQAAG